MQVTRAVDYGIRALLVMASSGDGRRFYLNELAEGAEVPRNYLVKILKALSHAGLVSSFRGVWGGFALARDPEDISLRDIIEAVDGPIGIVPCLTGSNGCPRRPACAAHETFRAIREKLLAEMGSHSLAELARREAGIRADAQPRSAAKYGAAGAPIARQASMGT
ncbi:MAG: Rrf2 family transcriptional regulator [Planctomycetota bacterium]|nr:Rrf2 family transcriptional regulator [Planctomycetota bacterium]